MPRKEKRIKVERGLYQQGDVMLACVTPPGERQARWRTLGPVGIMQARRMRGQFAAELDRGELPAAVAGRMTFGELAREWLAEQERLRDIGELSPKTYENYESALRLHILGDDPEVSHRRWAVLGRRPAASIRPEHLVAWHGEQLAAGAAAWSIKGRWTALRLVLVHATRRRAIVTNPADLLSKRERPKPGQSRKRFLSRDEIKLLLAKAPELHRAAIATALFTGLRVNEVLGLQWRDVDLDAGVVRVTHQMDRKTRKRRRLKTPAARRDVVLMQELAAVLRRHRLASRHSGARDLVFGTILGTTIGDRNLAQRGLEPAVEAAGLEDVTFHVLRHTFASILIAQGRSVDYVSRQLGHTNAGYTLATYVHEFDAHRHAEEARKQLDDEFGGLLRSSR